MYGCQKCTRTYGPYIRLPCVRVVRIGLNSQNPAGNLSQVSTVPVFQNPGLATAECSECQCLVTDKRRRSWWNLVLVELAVLVLLLALVLERDDDEADEDVDHEERDDDDVDEVEDGDHRPMVVHRAVVRRVRIHALVHQPTTPANSAFYPHRSGKRVPPKVQ